MRNDTVARLIRVVAAAVGLILLQAGTANASALQQPLTPRQLVATETTRPGPAGACNPDYCAPADWDTERVDTITPGIEPLNVIVSGRSTVRREKILRALSQYVNWDEVRSGTWFSPPGGCLSFENANVDGTGYVHQNLSLRVDKCLKGNELSLAGLENHARVWFQRRTGAWFITAAYETACYRTLTGKLKPLGAKWKTLALLRAWHCIDGGEGSRGADGYNRGARDLVVDIRLAAAKSGWDTSLRIVTRPLEPGGDIGEDGVRFDNRVYIVTVGYKKPSGRSGALLGEWYQPDDQLSITFKRSGPRSYAGELTGNTFLNTCLPVDVAVEYDGMDTVRDVGIAGGTVLQAARYTGTMTCNSIGTQPITIQATNTNVGVALVRCASSPVEPIMCDPYGRFGVLARG